MYFQISNSYDMNIQIVNSRRYVLSNFKHKCFERSNRLFQWILNIHFESTSWVQTLPIWTFKQLNMNVQTKVHNFRGLRFESPYQELCTFKFHTHLIELCRSCTLLTGILAISAIFSILRVPSLRRSITISSRVFFVAFSAALFSRSTIA